MFLNKEFLSEHLLFAAPSELIVFSLGFDAVFPIKSDVLCV